jgi:hypothetical protein
VKAAANEIFIEGVGFWASRLPGWETARSVLRGEASATLVPAPRPSPGLLPAAERRRAPDTVAIALEVAARACEHAHRDPKTLSSVFASTHGDLAISDSLCETLASAPGLTSPIKFHNSVHNAAAGYWTIGTGCMKAYTALSAYTCTFAQGLLESAVQTSTERAPVLFVSYDIEARGPVATMQPSRGMLAGALVVAPEAGKHCVARLSWEVCESGQATFARPENAALVEDNAMANCLALFEALADETACEVVQALAPHLCLRIHVEPT